MKKIFLILLMVLMSVSMVMALDMTESRFSVGASFGTSGSSEKSFSANNAVAQSSKFGYVFRLRGDYRFAEDYTATLMLSYDSPNKSVMVNNLKGSLQDTVGKLSYLKLFIGASRHFVAKDNLLVALGFGPELSIDLVYGSVGISAATYGRFSYRLEGTNVLFDSTVKGSAEWIKDLPDEDTHFYLDGDVSLGFTYMF